jgi:PAS domain S-box-containing protein
MTDYSQLFQIVEHSSNRAYRELQSQLGHVLQYSNGQSEEVRRAFEALLGHYAKHHPEPQVAITDSNGVMVEVNDAFVRASRYERLELIGEKISILKSSQTEDGLFTDLWNNITEGKPWRGEIQNRGKDYEVYAVDLLILPILGPSGKPERYWSIGFDVTERSRSEAALIAKNAEHADSLKYAKRIQTTILPDKASMDNALGDKDYFVVFKPKDIVSGDFYWFYKSIRTAYLAVVDCTGHGVPGAFMSLIGYNLLNQIVMNGTANNKYINPGQVLSELHKMLRANLKQDATDSKSRDGMDVCLVAIDLFDDSFEYAGANRPLFFWRKGELQEVKPDKFSIGGEQLEEERRFTNHQIEVEAGDIIYMVSDGYVDQFGGPEKKKFSTKKFKQLITEVNHETMNVQKAMFNMAWKDWKEDDEQIDDVTLIAKRWSE